jgi:hypothetical protein
LTADRRRAAKKAQKEEGLLPLLSACQKTKRFFDKLRANFDRGPKFVAAAG